MSRSAQAEGAAKKYFILKGLPNDSEDELDGELTVALSPRVLSFKLAKVTE